MRTWWIGLCAALMACDPGGGADRTGSKRSDLVGTWEVTGWTVAEGACVGTGVDAEPPFPFFTLTIEAISGIDTLVLTPCATATSCGGDPLEISYFDTFSNDHASGQVREASFDGISCTLVWIDGTLDATASGLDIVRDTSRVEGATGADIDQCIEAQDAWSATRPCIEHEQGTAVRVE